MSRIKDIVGERFGKLTVVRYLRTDVKPYGRTVIWECKCDCGNIVEVSTSALRSGNTKSCGCLKSENLVGMKFGRLTVMDRESPKSKKTKGLWICKCECGNVIKVNTSALKSGNTTSCGCKRKETLRQLRTKHGESDTRLYKVWLDMKRRCYNAKDVDYKNYGGRGITVCDEWKDSFVNFSQWAYENGYDKDAPKGQCTIDRIDVNGCYEPENCRWVNIHIQSNNKRNNRILTYNGESHTLSEWCEIVNIPYNCLQLRLNKLHWSVEKTLTTPTRNKIH